MTDEMKIEETTAAEETARETVPEAEMSFDQMLEESIKTIYNGDTVKCIVAAITPTEISVDLGTKHSGYIPVSEFTDDTDVPIDQLVKVGDTIDIYAEPLEIVGIFESFNVYENGAIVMPLSEMRIEIEPP